MIDDAPGEEQLLDLIEAQFVGYTEQEIAVAVSGGSDSVALLVLMTELSKRIGLRPVAISIDHRLRLEAEDELQSVMSLCGRLGVPHHVETWRGWDGQGNLQDAARQARLDLITNWAQSRDISTVALGHTADDQAETVLMRLARGSGVNGLSAMAPRRLRQGLTWVRPLLSVSRRALRHYLRQREIDWVEDPSNADPSFERVRMRNALPLLEPLGLTVEGLSRVAEQMRGAREALDWQTFLAAKDMLDLKLGAVRLDLRRFRALPREIGRRLLIRVVMWISSSRYPPRRDSVENAMAALRHGAPFTLDGVQVQRDGEAMWLFREYAAVASLNVEVGDVWDERWTLEGPEDDPEFTVRALGEVGILQVVDWRNAGVPRAAVLSMPAVWSGDSLVAAPLLDDDTEWSAEIAGGSSTFFAELISH
ncbi:MAG: tRNA lysidine(34) synthetase TilS [Pseudomonadota bacterium]